jgi:hypothetical protein
MPARCGGTIENAMNVAYLTLARRTTVTSILALGLFAGCASFRPPVAPRAENGEARRVLCPDVGEAACIQRCRADADARDHVDCLLRFRFAPDPEALELARTLYLETKALVGVAPHTSIEGYRGESVELFPTVPVGEHRHHLQWLRTSLVAFDDFLGMLRAWTTKPITFHPRPKAILFFRTSAPSYPSAYSLDGVIGYNVEGPLHADPREMHETLFHELFHLNDATRGAWSDTALGPLFDSIVERCGDRHDCLTPYAPHATVVPDGTYYAFDPRTGGVREYGAELAVRYFLEHEAILDGAELPPFKCRAPENQVAWGRLVDEFFGGVDLSPECDTTPPS